MRSTLRLSEKIRQKCRISLFKVLTDLSQNGEFDRNRRYRTGDSITVHFMLVGRFLWGGFLGYRSDLVILILPAFLLHLSPSLL